MLTQRADRAMPPGSTLLRGGHAALALAIIAVLALVAAAAINPQARPTFTRIILASPIAGYVQGRADAARWASARNGAEPRLKEARRLNAAIPFFREALVPAPPFHFTGSNSDRDRAVDCLALAAMAEAGAGDEGQRAVIQVILNRVRHPAFAKSICGVVFEGSHRSTGCQFTFTCDGALARRYAASAWTHARARAIEALDGRVYPGVGLATHYHTDWVHPYWSASLLKLARVETHLFFRWPGRWGSPGQLKGYYGGNEPAIAQLSYLPAHSEGARIAAVPGGDASTAINHVASSDVLVRNGDGGAFVLLSASRSAASAQELGRSICANRPSCKVFGWFEKGSIPSGYPVPAEHRAKLGFSYFRGASNEEIVLFDCSRFSGVAIDKCLPRPARNRRESQAALATEAASTFDQKIKSNDEMAKFAGLQTKQ